MWGFFTAVANIFRTGVDRYGEVREAKHKATLKRIEASARVAELSAEHTANIEMEWARQMRYSWKDEYALILLTAPLVVGAHPYFRVHLLEYFQFLDSLPYWWQLCLMGAIGASFGIRLLPLFMQGIKGRIFGAKASEGSETPSAR